MPRRIVIDCDPGVDDAAAILLALASPELQVLGITVVGGNVSLADTALNARKIVHAAGRSDIAVFAGCPGPLMRPQVFGKYAHIGAIGDDVWPAPAAPLAAAHAVAFIAPTARAAAHASAPVTMCCMAPLTNLALALAEDATVAQGIDRIVMMGGAFTALGNRVPWAEFNVYADPHAASIVLAAGIPITMMPLDVTFQALMTPADLARLGSDCGGPGRALGELIRRFDRRDPARLGSDGIPLHDPTVIAWLLAPELFEGRPAAVGVECQSGTAGHTTADFYARGTQPVNAEVMQTMKARGFYDLLLERLARFA